MGDYDMEQWYSWQFVYGQQLRNEPVQEWQCLQCVQWFGWRVLSEQCKRQQQWCGGM